MKKIGLLLALSFISSEPSSAQSYQDLKVGAVTLRVPFPKGYCVPVGLAAVSFKELAVTDDRNVTLLSLVDCESDSTRNRYLLVKAPKADLGVTVTASDFRALAQAADDTDMAKTSSALTKEVGANKTEASGVQTEVKGAVTFRGHDDNCIYMSASMSTVKPDKTQNQVMGGCMTMAGSRFISLYAYEDTEEPLSYKSMLPMLKQWASQIRPVLPKRSKAAPRRRAH